MDVRERSLALIRRVTPVRLPACVKIYALVAAKRPKSQLNQAAKSMTLAKAISLSLSNIFPPLFHEKPLCVSFSPIVTLLRSLRTSIKITSF